jgi:hypothetical protein
MALQIDVIPGRHELVRLRLESLMHAIDNDKAPISAALARFIEAIEAHAALEFHLEYRSLASHTSPGVRASAAHLLNEQPDFSARFERFARRWLHHDEAALRTPAFRDDLDHIVAAVLTRIKLEERIVAALGSAA